MTLLRQISDGVEEAIRRVEAAQRALPDTGPTLDVATTAYQLGKAWYALNELRVVVNEAAEAEETD